MVAAAVAMVLVTTGVTLAATGDRPFSDTPTLTEPPHAARPHTGLLPPGARAFSVAADGRAWVAIPQRVLLHGAPRSAIAVSPGAVYVLEAHGRTLRAVAAGTGRVAQTQHAAGPVGSAVWSPFPIRIAYLTEVGSHQQLHDEWDVVARLPGRPARGCGGAVVAVGLAGGRLRPRGRPRRRPQRHQRP